ncbi:MAG: hypothetical protein CL462_13305 [Acidimicrobiaceae bacterium]|nr:hypothetical protein [Acidimicrobiaceae bacterium]
MGYSLWLAFAVVPSDQAGTVVRFKRVVAVSNNSGAEQWFRVPFDFDEGEVAQSYPDRRRAQVK